MKPTSRKLRELKAKHDNARNPLLRAVYWAELDLARRAAALASGTHTGPETLCAYLRRYPVTLKTAGGSWVDTAQEWLELFGLSRDDLGVKADKVKRLTGQRVYRASGGILRLNALPGMDRMSVNTPERAVERCQAEGFDVADVDALRDLVAAELRGMPVYRVNESPEHDEPMPARRQSVLALVQNRHHFASGLDAAGQAVSVVATRDGAQVYRAGIRAEFLTLNDEISLLTGADFEKLTLSDFTGTIPATVAAAAQPF